MGTLLVIVAVVFLVAKAKASAPAAQQTVSFASNGAYQSALSEIGYLGESTIGDSLAQVSPAAAIVATGGGFRLYTPPTPTPTPAPVSPATGFTGTTGAGGTGTSGSGTGAALPTGGSVRGGRISVL